MTAPPAGLRGGWRTHPRPPLSAITSQQCTVARRHHSLVALSQTPSGASMPSPLRFPTIQHPSHSHAIVKIIPWTAHIIMRHSSITPAYSPKTTRRPLRPATPRLPPWRSTPLHPMDCVRSEGKCRRSGDWPGPLDQDHAACSTVRSALGSLRPLPDLLLGSDTVHSLISICRVL